MSVRIDDAARRIEVGVGDLLPAADDDPFAPSRSSFTRMLLGSRAHVAYQAENAAQDETFESEVQLRAELVVDDWTVAIAGRVDGLRRRADGVVIEELKSVMKGEADFEALRPEWFPGYVLQLRIYLHLLSLTGTPGSPEPRGLLVFVNLLGSGRRSFPVAPDHDLIRRLITAQVRQLLTAHEAARRRRHSREELGRHLEFPFPERRPHQQEMEQECRRALDAGECILVSAPPGLGKTAAALSAALEHALRNDRRVFFVTSKTTQQRIVSTTLQRIATANPGVTAVVLQAKAKICANETVFCHADFCEFARDYPGKVATGQVREHLIERGICLPEDIFAAGLTSRACPFELSLDLTDLADVVVGDYNYVFDPQVALHRQLEDGGAADLVLVIDEAHNLLERARAYYSPHFAAEPARELLAIAHVRPGEVYRQLESWLEATLTWLGHLVDGAEDEEPLLDPAGGPPRIRIDPPREPVRRLKANLERFLAEYVAFRRACGGVEPDDPVLALAYDFLRFARVVEHADEAFVVLVGADPAGQARVDIVCLDPSRLLAKRLASFHGVIAMSATLEPEAYYRDLLGLPSERTHSLSLPSPFSVANRRILVVPSVVTTWRDRHRYYDKAEQTIRSIIESQTGHWVAFFPSFRYLHEIEHRLGRLPGELLVQHEGMQDADRQALLQRLERPDGRPRLLLAVLGGVFAEGVDLPGEALVGVIIVSPGLPQVTLERELLRQRFEEQFGAGFDYAYLVPGLGKVVQAAGRLVRTPTDRGVVVLLDQRFASPTYSRYFPRDWYDTSPSELIVRDPSAAIESFFHRPSLSGRLLPFDE